MSSNCKRYQDAQRSLEVTMSGRFFLPTECTFCSYRGTRSWISVSCSFAFLEILRNSFVPGRIFYSKIKKKNALASGQPPVLRYTHAGFCASRWRYAPFSGKMRCGARGRLASLGAVPCGGCMVRSACAIFCAASAVATPVRRRVQRQCLCCLRERSRCLSTTVCSRCRH